MERHDLNHGRREILGAILLLVLQTFIVSNVAGSTESRNPEYVVAKGVGSIPASLLSDGTVCITGADGHAGCKEALLKVAPEIADAISEERGTFYGLFDLDKDGEPEVFLDYFKMGDPECQDHQEGTISCVHLIVYKRIEKAYETYLDLQAQSWGYAPGAWFLDEPPHPKAVFMTRYAGSSGFGLFYLDLEKRSLDLITDGLFIEDDPVFEDTDGDGVAEIFVPARGRDRTASQGAGILHWKDDTYKVWWPDWSGVPYVIYARLVDLDNSGNKGIVAILEPEEYSDDKYSKGELKGLRALGLWRIKRGAPVLVSKVKLPNAKRDGEPEFIGLPLSPADIQLSYSYTRLVKCIYRKGKMSCEIGKKYHEPQYEPVGKSFRVHGRLSIHNGIPSCRIWIVGTNRAIGVDGTDAQDCPIPRELLRILQEDVNDRLIYADFVVSPFTEYRRGVMQIVRFESAENIVVTKRDMHFLRRLSGPIR